MRQHGHGFFRRMQGWLLPAALVLAVIPPDRAGAQWLPGEPISLAFTNLVVDELGDVRSAQPGPELPAKPAYFGMVPVQLRGHIVRPLGQELTLRWVGGTAIPGRDFVLRSWSVDENPTATTLKLPAFSEAAVQGFIRVIDDGSPDPERVALFQLEGPPGASLGAATNLTLTLVDAPSLIVAEARVLETEAHSGTLVEGRTSEMEFIVYRHGATNPPVTVDFRIATNRLAWTKGGIPEDPGRITLAAGQRTASIRVSIANDARVNPGPVSIRLTGVSGDARLPATDSDFAFAAASMPVFDDEDTPNLDAAFSARTLDGPLGDLVELPGGGWIGVLQWSIQDASGDALQVVRIRPDGSHDPTYQGRIALSGPLQLPVRGLAAFPDGRVVVAWAEMHDGEPVCGLMALGPDGRPDPGFRPPGELAGRCPGDFLALPEGGLLCQTSDGVAHLGRDGAVTDLPSLERYSSAAVAPDGGILLMAGVPVRLRPDLSPDPAFAVDLGGQPGLGSGTFHPLALAVDSANRIWASFEPSGRGGMGRILRLLPDGRLDPEVTPIPLQAYALRAYGRGVVVLGREWSRFPEFGQWLLGIGEDGAERFREWVGPEYSRPKMVGADARRIVLFQGWGLEAPSPGRFASIRIDAPASRQVHLFPSLRGLPEVPGPGEHLRTGRIARYELEEAAYVAIRRSGSTVGPATVRWRTVDGTARAGEDFVGVVEGRIDFLPLEVERRVRIPLLSDRMPEGPEYFEVAVTGVEGIEEIGPNLRLWIVEHALSVAGYNDAAGATLGVRVSRHFGHGGWRDHRGDRGYGYSQQDREPILRFEVSQDLRQWTAASVEMFEWVDSGRRAEVQIQLPTAGVVAPRPPTAGFVRMGFDFEGP